METIQLLSSPYDNRPHSHQGIATISPADSPPRVQRPPSQSSIHMAPQSVAQSPVPTHDQFSGNTFTSMTYRPYQPQSISLPSPQQHYMYPSTAPPMAFYPTSNGYDPRSVQMMRTVSHAHPLHSADPTASSRYSSSPHSGGQQLDGGPASASYHWQMGTPAMVSQEHVNPSVFERHSNNPPPMVHNGQNDYSMSRSTSGASDAVDARLLTPHIEYREQLSPAAADLRKVSDSLGYPRYGNLDRYTPGPPQGYPQPQQQYWGREVSGGGDVKPFDGGRYQQEQQQRYHQQQQHHDLPVVPENEYERERMEQISGNRKLLETLGLGGGPARPNRQMSTSDARSRKVTTPKKRMADYNGLVRASPRIASLHRNVSYMDLDGAPASEASDDSFVSDDAIYEEEEDFRPAKRGRGHKGSRKAYIQRPRKAQVELSLWGLLQTYPQIPELFPLFYYTLNNDLSINSDSVPLIGSIPSTVTPLEKADILRNYFQRGRRVLNQLDCFTGRCDRKYEGPEERWNELDHNTRIAIRDVRRKIVERCENYKYTRRDILDKNVGKNKWAPIELGMIEWKFGQTTGDPASDLSNVTLTLPTPPPGALLQTQQQQQQVPDYHSRTIRPMPSRNRIASSNPRSVSITMAEPGTATAYPQSALGVPYSSRYYGSHSPAPPMYGEDQVPMTVQMPAFMNNGPVGPPPLGSGDPRLSVGFHTPLVTQQGLESSSPELNQEGLGTATWGTGVGELEGTRGMKREGTTTAESDGSE